VSAFFSLRILLSPVPCDVELLFYSGAFAVPRNFKLVAVPLFEVNHHDSLGRVRFFDADPLFWILCFLIFCSCMTMWRNMATSSHRCHRTYLVFSSTACNKSTENHFVKSSSFSTNKTQPVKLNKATFFLYNI
jgi:hypothetical protein